MNIIIELCTCHVWQKALCCMLGVWRIHRWWRTHIHPLGYNLISVIVSSLKSWFMITKARPMNVDCGNSEHSLHSGCYLNLIIKQPIFEKDRLRQSGKEVWELLRSPEKQLYGWSGGERCWKYRPGSKDRKAGSQTEKFDVLLWALEGLPRGMWLCDRHHICLFCTVNAFFAECSLLIFVLVTGIFWLQGDKSLLKSFHLICTLSEPKRTYVFMWRWKHRG